MTKHCHLQKGHWQPLGNYPHKKTTRSVRVFINWRLYIERRVNDVDVARFLTTLVEVLIKKREYELADKEIERFRRILESSPDLEARSHLEGALSYFAGLCSDQGQYDLAAKLCQQGLEVAEKKRRP